jgi:hypothetical protein
MALRVSQKVVDSVNQFRKSLDFFVDDGEFFLTALGQDFLEDSRLQSDGKEGIFNFMREGTRRSAENHKIFLGFDAFPVFPIPKIKPADAENRAEKRDFTNRKENRRKGLGPPIRGMLNIDVDVFAGGEYIFRFFFRLPPEGFPRRPGRFRDPLIKDEFDSALLRVLDRIPVEAVFLKTVKDAFPEDLGGVAPAVSGGEVFAVDREAAYPFREDRIRPDGGPHIFLSPQFHRDEGKHSFIIVISDESCPVPDTAENKNRQPGRPKPAQKTGYAGRGTDRYFHTLSIPVFGNF